MDKEYDEFRKHLFLIYNLRIIYQFKENIIRNNKNKCNYMNNIFKYMESYVDNPNIKSKNLKSFCYYRIRNLLKKGKRRELDSLFTSNIIDNLESINVIKPSKQELEDFIRMIDENNIKFKNIDIFYLYKKYFNLKRINNSNNNIFDNYKIYLKSLRKVSKQINTSKLSNNNFETKKYLNNIKKLWKELDIKITKENKYKIYLISRKLIKYLNVINNKIDNNLIN